MSQPPIISRGNWEYTTLGLIECRRQKGATEWIPIEQPPAEILTLSLVLESQPMDEPDHWLLSVVVKDGNGKVYQVKGGAQLMEYTHADGVDILRPRLRWLRNRLSASRSHSRPSRDHANREAPLSAPDRASVTENCQAWTVRVLERLAEGGIVTEERLLPIKAMLQPV